MIGDEIAIHELRGLAVTLEDVVAAVLGRKLLLDDVGFDRDTEMVGLGSEIGSVVIVDAIDLERVITEVAPQHGEHSELVRTMERLGNLDDLMMRLG